MRFPLERCSVHHNSIPHPEERALARVSKDGPHSAAAVRLFPQILLHLRAQAVAQVGAGHAEGDIGAQEAGLGAAIMPLTLELDAVEALALGKSDHRVGELAFAA